MAKKSAPKKFKTKRQPSSNGVSKAQSIRDTAKELGKKARPKDIITALAAKGVSVSYALVDSTLGKRQDCEEDGVSGRLWRWSPLRSILRTATVSTSTNWF
jgi:hypothetical protein